MVEIIYRLSGSNITVMIEFPFKNTPVQVFILGKNSTFLNKGNTLCLILLAYPHS